MFFSFAHRYAHTGIVASEDNGQEIAATSTASSVVPNNMEFLLQSDTLQGDPSNTSKPAPESDIVNVVSGMFLWFFNSYKEIIS